MWSKSSKTAILACRAWCLAAMDESVSDASFVDDVQFFGVLSMAGFCNVIVNSERRDLSHKTDTNLPLDDYHCQSMMTKTL